MNNEEKILGLLSKIEEIQVQQGELLTQQEKALAKLTADVSELRETVTRVAIMQENVVLPRLDTLAEGHTHLAKTLAHEGRVEQVEDDVSTLWSTVKSHAERISRLEKAQ